MLQLPAKEQSLWHDAYPSHSVYPSLQADMETDVVVIGAGITGLTTAYLLKQSGLKVIVLEKHVVGGGTTGRTTGKVTSQHAITYVDMVQRLGTQAARVYAEANQTAVACVGAIIQKERIACDWQPANNYVFTDNPHLVRRFEDEARTAASLGLPASFETTTPLPFDVHGAVKFTGQAKMHAQKYVLGLARAVQGDGCHVFEHSTAIGIRDGSTCRVRTHKATVRSKHIVVASSVPTIPLLARGSYALSEAPSETYAVAGLLPIDLPDMYISPDKDHNSILPITIKGRRMILIVGEGHFWGLRGDRHARFEHLAAYAERHFGVTTITHRWSDRDYVPYDGVPLVGKLYPWSIRTFVGTGFKKWGLSNGTAAAMILCDLVTGTPNAWASTYRSTRVAAFRALPHVIARLWPENTYRADP